MTSNEDEGEGGAVLRMRPSLSLNESKADSPNVSVIAYANALWQ